MNERRADDIVDKTVRMRAAGLSIDAIRIRLHVSFYLIRAILADPDRARDLLARGEPIVSQKNGKYLKVRSVRRLEERPEPTQYCEHKFVTPTARPRVDLAARVRRINGGLTQRGGKHG